MLFCEAPLRRVPIWFLRTLTGFETLENVCLWRGFPTRRPDRLSRKSGLPAAIISDSRLEKRSRAVVDQHDSAWLIVVPQRRGNDRDDRDRHAHDHSADNSSSHRVIDSYVARPFHGREGPDC
jgi:hypothetical protein